MICDLVLPPMDMFAALISNIFTDLVIVVSKDRLYYIGQLDGRLCVRLMERFVCYDNRRLIQTFFFHFDDDGTRDGELYYTQLLDRLKNYAANELFSNSRIVYL